MVTLILPIIKEDEISSGISLLKKKKLLYSNKCIFCGKEVKNLSTNKDIGGFIPIKEREIKKVGLFCEELKCRLDAIYAVRKMNGNGSPLIEERK